MKSHRDAAEMKELPGEVTPYRRTPEFSETSVPKGLLTSHTTKSGTWGKIVVLEGALKYRILEPDLEEIYLDPDCHEIVEPTVKHEAQSLGRVTFYLQFYREDD